MRIRSWDSARGGRIFPAVVTADEVSELAPATHMVVNFGRHAVLSTGIVSLADWLAAAFYPPQRVRGHARFCTP